MKYLLYSNLVHLSVFFFITFIVGLIWPKIVMFWHKNPRRSKASGYSMLLMILVLIMAGFLKSDDIVIEIANSEFEKGNNLSESSIRDLIQIDSSSIYSAVAFEMLARADSINVADSLLDLRTKEELVKKAERENAREEEERQKAEKLALKELEEEEKLEAERRKKEEEKADNSFLAYNYAEDFVKEKLFSPSTADFPGTLTKRDHITRFSAYKYKIVSWVDSQNQYGATGRYRFACTIVFDGDMVKCTSLDFY